MKALRVIDGAPTLVDEPGPSDDGQMTDPVLVDIVSSSICGSDLHMIDMGIAEGHILGHEFAGRTPDGTAVAVEPTLSCGTCRPCTEGTKSHCVDGAMTMGVLMNGGMAQQILVPASTLVPLPSGLALEDGSLVEPVAVSLHAVNRANTTPNDRVLVIGAGPIGLAAVAVLSWMGITPDVAARHPHQQDAAQQLGGSLDVTDGYDVVIEAVGTSGSMRQAIGALRPQGRIALVGTLWEPLTVDMRLSMREATIVPSHTYAGVGPDHEFTNAARIVAETPNLASAMVTHRFPLDAGAEAFTAAADRKSGAIKVVFDI